MSVKTGDHVLIKPLSNRPGRVVGAQNTGRIGIALYLVRYEVQPGTLGHSQTSLYFDDELEKV